MNFSECVARASLWESCTDLASPHAARGISPVGIVSMEVSGSEVVLLRLTPRVYAVVRTRGLTFVRPEKSWRPIVNISIVGGSHDHGPSHEVLLGSDGQNPNLKSVIPV